LSGVMELAGRTGKNSALEGQGELSFSQGHIWQAPVFMGLVDVLHLSRPGAMGNFDRGEAQYAISEDHLHIQHFELRSPSAELTGMGMVGLEDGKLDLRVVAATVPEGGIPLLSPALKAIVGPVQRELIRVNITGTIEDPEYSYTIIGRLRRPFETLYDFFASPFRPEDNENE